MSEDLKIRGAYSASGLELIEPDGPDSFLREYLRVKGEGLMAVVLKVRDMGAAIKEFEEKGLIKSIDIQAGDMREVGFFCPDMNGLQIILAEYPAKHPATIAAWSIKGPAEDQ